MSRIEHLMLQVLGAYGTGKTRLIHAVSEVGAIWTELEYLEEEVVQSRIFTIGIISIVKERQRILLFEDRDNKLVPSPSTWLKAHPSFLNYLTAYILILDHRIIDNADRDSTAINQTLLERVQSLNAPYILLANRRKDVESYSLTEMRVRYHIPADIPFIESDISDSRNAKVIVLELLKLMPQVDLVQAAIGKLNEIRKEIS